MGTLDRPDLRPVPVPKVTTQERLLRVSRSLTDAKLELQSLKEAAPNNQTLSHLAYSVNSNLEGINDLIDVIGDDAA